MVHSFQAIRLLAPDADFALAARSPALPALCAGRAAA
jgi:hypothetical protein